MCILHANIGPFCEMAGTDKDVNFQTVWSPRLVINNFHHHHSYPLENYKEINLSLKQKK